MRDPAPGRNEYSSANVDGVIQNQEIPPPLQQNRGMPPTITPQKGTL